SKKIVILDIGGNYLIKLPKDNFPQEITSDDVTSFLKGIAKSAFLSHVSLIKEDNEFYEYKIARIV
ncbi:MAG: hypothetical protein ACFFD1_04900, partial [Candidatus Thorarchaeota archaeon]